MGLGMITWPLLERMVVAMADLLGVPHTRGDEPSMEAMN
jgi:hypothetical protein